MRPYNRRRFGPPRGEIDQQAADWDERPPKPKFVLPRVVIDDLIQVRNYLYRLSRRIVEDDYDGPGSRDGVSIGCDCFGDILQNLLNDCGHGLERYPTWWPEECVEGWRF